MSRIRPTKEVIAYWNNFAQLYEQHFLKTTKQVNQMLLSMLEVSANNIVAEAGCGTGSGIELLLNNYPNISKVLANDISEVILSMARSKNLPKTEYFLANSENLPYESSTCDRYISNLCLQNSEFPQKAFNEAWRVLKPGGICALSVWGRMEDINFHCIMRKCLNDAGVEPPKDKNFFHLNDKENLIKMMKNAGFSEVRSFYSAVPFLFVNLSEAISAACNSLECIKLRESDPLKYDLFVDNFSREIARIWSSGSALTFDFLAVVAFKA